MALLFETEREDRAFVVLASLVFVLALLVSLWEFVAVQGMVFRFSVLSITGLVLFVVGVSIRLVGKRTLGKYYSYGLRVLPDHKLVTGGIYRYVRHPISLAVLVYDPGISLIFSSLYGFLITLALVPLILYRITVEERMLIQKFGDEYRNYMRRTKKIIPFLY
jgi:protein-S-isoprenylcysteine O-methyltransferase Ste14